MSDGSVVTSNDKELRRARALARALDSAIGIPGTPIRIGLDAILGLIPGAGDIAGGVLAAYVVITAAQRGVPPSVLWRMIGNIAIDTLIGSVPVLGDLFDVGFKSNVRNVELLERATTEPAAVARSSRGFVILVVAILLLAIAGIATLGFLAARLVWQLLTS